IAVSHEHAAGVGGEVAADELEEGRLPTPGRAEEGEEPAGRDGERHAVHDGGPAVTEAHAVEAEAVGAGGGHTPTRAPRVRRSESPRSVAAPGINRWGRAS